MSGFVTLVGAGPGHPDYLTIKGLRSLERADVVVYDALLDPSFKFLFPKNAEQFFVGKRCGQHHLTQEQIHHLLIAQASQGKHVVRLKGGDPFIFGRGGEECMALADAGIPFEVVPGVSALNSVGGFAGIPLTHRNIANKALFLECHPQSLDKPDWKQLAEFDGTVVVFMGTRAIAEIASRLIAHGAEPSTPIALVENGGLVNQTATRSTLGEAAAGSLVPQTNGPGLIYIGDVVNLELQAVASEKNIRDKSA